MLTRSSNQEKTKKMKKLDLFGSELQGLSPFVNAQQRLNCFYEIISSGEKESKVFIRPTPGYSFFTTLSVGPIQGWIVVGSLLYVVSNTVLYSVNAAGAVTNLGTLITTNFNSLMSLATNGNQIIICTGSSGYLYYVNTTAAQGAGAKGGVVASSLVQGSGYTSGVYTGVPLIGGTGSGAVATFTVTSGAVTSIAITTPGTNYTVGDVLTVSNTYLGGAGSGFSATLTSVQVPVGSLQKINDSGFNPTATSVCFLNGFFIIPGTVSYEWQISTVYDGSQWPALQFASNEASPDSVVAVNALNGSLILWGQNHIEYWQDTGSFPFPFGSLQAAQSVGLAALYSRCAFNNTFAFLATNSAGTLSIQQLNGYTPVRISTPNIENIINSFVTYNDAISFSYALDGHVFFQITFPTAGRSFLYDASTQLWSELQSGIGSYSRHNANLSISFNANVLISDSTSPIIYYFNQEALTDNGSLIKRQVITKHIEDGGNLLGIDELWLDVNLGQGLQSGQGSNPQISLQVSKDNGNTYGNELWTSIGKVGQYQGPRAIWRRLGQSRDFVFKFTFTDPISLIIIRGSASVRPTNEREAYKG